MADKIQIVNIALALLGEPPIIDFTDDNAAARAAEVIWDHILDVVLRAHLWNFAMKRVNLALSASTPAFGFTRLFDLPSDFIRLRTVNAAMRSPYRLEGNKVATDASEVELLYVSRVTDTAQFDPLFVEALAARIAAHLALPIVNSTDIEERLWERYENKLGEARSADAQENPPDVLIAEDFIEARIGGVGGFRPIEDA